MMDEEIERLAGAIEGALNGVGFGDAIAGGIAEVITETIADEYRESIGRVLYRLLQRLDVDPAGNALKRVLVGDCGESRKAAARRLGCSPNALRKAEAAFRAKLGSPR